MNELRTLRRPVMHFDVGVGPSHVTFDDGQVLRRSLPWGDFVQARWGYADPGLIQVEIGAWLVEIRYTIKDTHDTRSIVYPFFIIDEEAK